MLLPCQYRCSICSSTGGRGSFHTDDHQHWTRHALCLSCHDTEKKIIKSGRLCSTGGCKPNGRHHMECRCHKTHPANNVISKKQFILWFQKRPELFQIYQCTFCSTVGTEGIFERSHGKWRDKPFCIPCHTAPFHTHHAI